MSERTVKTMMQGFLVTWLILLAGCQNPDEPEQEGRGEWVTDQQITVNEIARNYQLYLPVNRQGATIVLLLHGNSGSSDQLRGLPDLKSPFKLWEDIAIRENLVLVIPDGLLGPNDKQGWNDCRNDAPTNPDSDDVAFLTALIKSVQDEYSASNTHVFSVGISNGALMTMRLANEVPQMLKAIALIVASKPVNTECLDSSVPVPVLFMNGTEDPILPYFGGQIKGNRGEVYSTPDTINYWIERNAADVTPIETIIPDTDPDDGSSVRRYSYLNTSQETVIEHYEITNGGHTEPSIVERYAELYKLIVGNQNNDIEMTEEVWNFLKSF